MLRGMRDDNTIDAVIFDWGGTLTPWHTVDVPGTWRAVAALIDPDRADELAAALLAAEDEVWIRARDTHRSATLAEVCALAGVTMSDAAHIEYRTRWEPHSFIDPEAPAVLAGLRERGIKVGVLSNTIWTRDHHEEIFARDGVLELIDGAVYSSEIPWTKPHPEAFEAAMTAVGRHARRPAACSSATASSTTSTARRASACGRSTCRTARSRRARSATPRARRTPPCSALAELLPLVDAWHLRLDRAL